MPDAAGVTDPQVDLGVMTQAFTVCQVKGRHQTGLLTQQEQGPPDRVPLVLLHAVQLHLHSKHFQVHTCGDKHKP